MASKSRDEAVACTERNQSPSERPSSSRARRASQGAASGMPRAILLELPTQPGDVEQSRERQLRDGAVVGARPAAPVDHVLAVVVGRGGRNVQFGGQRQHGVLGGAHEGAAEVGGQPRDTPGERTPAHPITALVHQDVMALSRQLACGGQTGKAGTDHNDIDDPRPVCHCSSQPHSDGFGRQKRSTAADWVRARRSTSRRTPKGRGGPARRARKDPSPPPDRHRRRGTPPGPRGRSPRSRTSR